MPLYSGMSPEAPYFRNMEWGDSATANFFGTQASADGADPLSWTGVQVNKSPETLRSSFAVSPLTAWYRDLGSTSSRFGLGVDAPSVDSAGATPNAVNAPSSFLAPTLKDMQETTMIQRLAAVAVALILVYIGLREFAGIDVLRR